MHMCRSRACIACVLGALSPSAPRGFLCLRAHGRLCRPLRPRTEDHLGRAQPPRPSTPMPIL
eukprot:3088704-Pleurochrysis_carterae.AAC.1